MLRLSRCRPSILGALVLCACLLAGAGSAGAKVRAKPLVSQATVARRLVSTAVHARTPAAQSRAMLSIMKALQIGVVTPAGRPLSLGGEPAAAGLFELYSAELGPLGASVTRAPSLTLDDLAANLSRAGLALNSQGKAIPTSLLHSTLISAVKAAVRHPGAPGSLMPLIVRQLGLSEHPSYDLTKSPAVAKIHLSSLQAWLLSSDLEISVLRHIRLSALRAAHVVTAARVPVARPASALGDACQKYTDLSDKLEKAEQEAAGGKLSKMVAGKIVGHFGDLIQDAIVEHFTRGVPPWVLGLGKSYLEDTQQVLKLANTVLQGIHGSLLSASISVHTQENATSLPTVHWYHQPGEAGHQLTFAIVVEMLDNYGDALIKCGDLTGYKFPPKGGIPGVKVLWDQAEGKLTPDMGTLQCSLAAIACNSTTDANGVASVTFTPNTEVFPGIGLQLDSSGVMDGVAAYQTGAGAGMLGQIAQVLVPKYAGLRWRVTYHQEPKLSVRVVDEYDRTYTNQTINQYESTGTGSLQFSLSALVPLARTTATDGTNVWSGTAPINWDTFVLRDDNQHSGVGSDCEGGNSQLSHDGNSSSSGQLTVDSLTYDPTQGVAGLAVTLRASSLPKYSYTDTFVADKTVKYPCRDFTSTGSGPWTFPTGIGLLGSGVSYASGSSGGGGPLWKITGWTPGPAVTSGTGVYAYREVTVQQPSPYGEPGSSHFRIEIIAKPQ